MAHMDSPSAHRNKGPIWSVLQTLIQKLTTSSSSNDNGVNTYPLKVLEIAAGVGVHTIHFTTEIINCHSNTNNNINLIWYPSDPDPISRDSIQDRIQSCSNPIIQSSIYKPPLSITLDGNGIMEKELLENDIFKDCDIDLITCINMIHISPWEATIGLFHVAKEKLKQGGILYCYGPYKVNGTAVESNLNFDQSLKARNPQWGVRELEVVEALAMENGFVLDDKIEMPANNLSLVFRKL